MEYTIKDTRLVKRVTAYNWIRANGKKALILVESGPIAKHRYYYKSLDGLNKSFFAEAGKALARGNSVKFIVLNKEYRNCVDFI